MSDTQVSTYVWVVDNAQATPTAIALVSTAFSRMSIDIDSVLTARVDLTFKTPAQMISAGEVLSDGSAAWGYCHSSGRNVTINSRINGNVLPSEKTQYTVLHELGGHMSDHDVLNASKRASLMALMSPAGSTWSGGSYLDRSSECYADSFPRVYSDIDGVLVGYFNKQVPAGNYASYKTIVGGAGAPAAMALAAAASIGDVNIKVTSVTGLLVGDWVAIGDGSSPEERELTFVGTTGAGGTGVSFAAGLVKYHSSGAAVVEIPAPGAGDPPPPPDDGTTYSIIIGTADWTNRIPADSVHVSESGSDALATMEFTLEDQSGAFSDDFPWEVVITDLNGVRLFGGNMVGARRRHMAGNRIAWDCRAVSWDAWLDRRYLPAWWTTDTGLQGGTNIGDDQLIVQRIVADGDAGGVLTTSGTYVKSTNAAMPKLNLQNGSLREHILAVAEAAATVGDPNPRRVYVDFYKRVHYFKSSENTPAPYRIGNANYSVAAQTTTGLVSYWPMSEATGATCYDTKSVSNMALSGYYVRGVTPGVVNEIVGGAVQFGARSVGLVSHASYHPGNTFSVECWFQRSVIGSQQVLFDAGTGDYAIEFDSTDHIRIYKKGTGTDFVTTGTVTDGNWHHLVVTHTGAATKVYLNGVDKAGTLTIRSFAPSTNSLYIGQLADGTLKYNGSLQKVAFYSVALSSGTSLTHYNAGVTVVPDSIDYDTDYNDSGFSVYVAGFNAAGTGWSAAAGPSPYGANTIIDRPQSDSAGTKTAIETAFLKRDFAPVMGGRFTVTGFDGWHAGQTVTVADTGLGVSGDYEIRSLEVSMGPGSGVFTYDIYYGSMPWRGTFDIQRKNRRKSHA